MEQIAPTDGNPFISFYTTISSRGLYNIENPRFEKYFKEYKDMFNNYNLITKINPNYKLYRNTKMGCFVILNSAKNNQICLNFIV